MVPQEKGIRVLRRRGFGSRGEGDMVPDERGIWFPRRREYMVPEEKGLGFLRSRKVEDKVQSRSSTAELEWVGMTSKNVHSL